MSTWNKNFPDVACRTIINRDRLLNWGNELTLLPDCLQWHPTQWPPVNDSPSRKLAGSKHHKWLVKSSNDRLITHRLCPNSTSPVIDRNNKKHSSKAFLQRLLPIANFRLSSPPLERAESAEHIRKASRTPHGFITRTSEQREQQLTSGCSRSSSVPLRSKCRRNTPLLNREGRRLIKHYRGAGLITADWQVWEKSPLLRALQIWWDARRRDKQTQEEEKRWHEALRQGDHRACKAHQDTGL